MVSITFEGVEVPKFLFVADLIATVGRWVLGLTLAHLYGLLMTWHVKSHKPVPIDALGEPPGDSLGAARLAYTLRFSAPALVLVLLFLAADFSSSLADVAGFDTEIMEMEGPNETVLDLTKRNPRRLLQVG